MFNGNSPLQTLLYGEPFLQGNDKSFAIRIVSVLRLLRIQMVSTAPKSSGLTLFGIFATRYLNRKIKTDVRNILLTGIKFYFNNYMLALMVNNRTIYQ